ncbi:hypothetical protein Tco_0278277 [Tanacetum coccineum]
MRNRLSGCKNHDSVTKCTDAAGDLWVERVISLNGVPWVGDGGVSGVSLSEESSVDDRNGEVVGSGGETVGISAGINMSSGWGHNRCGIWDGGRDTAKQDNSSSWCPHTLLHRI